MTDNSPLDPTSMTNCTGEVGEPAGQCNQEFTNQIKLVPVNGDAVVLKGVPWSVHFKNTTNQRGKTNDRGETERFKTSKPELFFALVGKLSEGFRKRGGVLARWAKLKKEKYHWLPCQTILKKRCHTVAVMTISQWLEQERRQETGAGRGIWPDGGE
ncbi:hypothetical protein GGER_19890 [Serratia rubidaea]